MATRNQVRSYIPNPTGKGGFQERPQDRNPGTWKPENTISFQYRRFMNMSPEELKVWSKSPDKEKTMAMEIAFGQVVQAKKSLLHAKEITDRTEGKAPQAVDITTNGKDLPTPIMTLSRDE